MLLRPSLLVLSAFAPRPHSSGGELVAFISVQAYARRFDVDVLFLYEATEHADVSEACEFCRSVVGVPMGMNSTTHRVETVARAGWSLMTGEPFRIAKFRVPAFASLVGERLRAKRYAVLALEGLSMAQYVMGQQEFTILTEQNVEWEIFERYSHFHPSALVRAFARVEAARLKRYEVAVCRTVDLVWTMSQRDRDVLRQAGAGDHVEVRELPVEPAKRIPAFAERRPFVISLGNLAAPGRAEGTYWFGHHVWPIVRAAVPDAEWHIIGRNPPAQVCALADGRTVQVHGFVPDLTDFLLQARACVVPLWMGGGIRVKIAEMMSAGIPCVSTTIGADGYEVLIGSALLVANEPDPFADAVIRLLTQSPIHEAYQAAGLAHVRQSCNPGIVLDSLAERVLQGMRDKQGG